jgi:hypothetical protein
VKLPRVPLNTAGWVVILVVTGLVLGAVVNLWRRL